MMKQRVSIEIRGYVKQQKASIEFPNTWYAYDTSTSELSSGGV